MGLNALRRVQVGLESTPGTSVAATSRLMGFSLGGNLNDRVVVQPMDQRASLAAHSRGYTTGYLWEDTLDGEATYEDIIYLLGWAIKGAITPSTVDTNAKKWLYTPSLTSANVPDTSTLEFGDDTQEYEAEYVFAKGLTISGAIDEPVKVSADVCGRQLSASSFTGSLTARTVEQILSQKFKLYMDDAGGTIGSTQKTLTLIDWQFKTGAHFIPKKHQDGNLYFSGYSEVAMAPELQLTMELNANTTAIRGKYTAETVQLVRLIGTGSLIGAVSALKTLCIDGAYRITKFDKIGEKNGADVVAVSLVGEYDSTYAKVFEIYAQNLVSTLP